MFLVTLATGHQGSAAARQLLALGHTVHAITRNKNTDTAKALSDAGATVFEGTLDDLSVVRAAIKGATGVFLNHMPMHGQPDIESQQTNNLLIAAKEAGTVQTIVLTTAFFTGKHRERAAEKPNYPAYNYFDSKRRVEELVLESGIPNITILRPAWLMHNYTAPVAQYHYPELRDQHILATAFKPGLRLPHFDGEDVGKFAVAALTNPEKFRGEEIELGFENLSPEDVATALGEVTGVNVGVRYRSEEEIEEMKWIPTQEFHLYANEFGVEISESSLDKYGIPLTRFEDYLRREKGKVKEALGVVD